MVKNETPPVREMYGSTAMADATPRGAALAACLRIGLAVTSDDELTLALTNRVTSTPFALTATVDSPLKLA